MKDLLDKLSSYNIFNYLLPGVVFVAISKSLTIYNFVQQDIVVGVFLYYFIGLVISRIGSIVIEPMLKWIRFVKFSDSITNSTLSDCWYFRLIYDLFYFHNRYKYGI